MIKSTTNPKIIYLDQKCWINLAKIVNNENNQSNDEIYNKIVQASKSGTAIFPISHDRLAETIKISNSRQKEQLVSVMVNISKGYSFRPYFGKTINAEIRNLILEKLGLPTVDIKKYVLGKGLGHLVGAEPSIEGNLPDEIKKQLLNLLDEPTTLIKIMSGANSLNLEYLKEVKANNRDGITSLEQNRQKLKKISNKEQRRRAFLAINLRAMIAPELAKIHYKLQLPKNFIIKKNWNDKDFQNLLDRIPTALCLFTLLYYRDQEYQREIKESDIYDISSLTTAIPYSDIVVTDKMMASIATRMKLDQKCKTIILKSILELDEYL